MIESPIKRKSTNYPKDFIPNEHHPKQHKRFTFNQEYQIGVQSIKKYQRTIEQSRNSDQEQTNTRKTHDNPENVILSHSQLQQEHPLDHHLRAKTPELDSDLIKKPRFSINDKQQFPEQNQQGLQLSSSPGSIKRQLGNRQGPLPLDNPCKIELVKSYSQRQPNLNNSCIKYRSTNEFQNKTWLSSEKDIISQFNTSRIKMKSSVKGNSQFPLVQNKNKQDDSSFLTAKQQYAAFRRKQESAGRLGQVNSLLNNIKKHQDIPNHPELPPFQQTNVHRLKQEINAIVRHKKGEQPKQTSEEEDEEEKQPEQEYRHRRQSKHVSSRRKTYFGVVEDNRPELLVSYRSSLPYLKDLYSKSNMLPSYHLVVKIPKLFVETLIFKDQDRQQLYQTAKKIFHQLKIPYQNLVIKKYTNCTMLIARNICLIWYFDGRRYLGGWQAQYLDQGVKHGLGLEWEPKKYVYYGEYAKNKKHGLGIFKDKLGTNYIGYWARGQRSDPTELGHSRQNYKHSYYQDSESQSDTQQQKASHFYQYL